MGRRIASSSTLESPCAARNGHAGNGEGTRAMDGSAIRRYLRALVAAIDDRQADERTGIVDRTSTDRRLWLAVVVATAADLGTTVGGLELGLEESNPAGVLVLESAGVLGLLGVKAIAVGFGLVITAAVLRAPDRIAPDSVALVVPAALASVWLLAATWNAYLLAIVLVGA